MKIRIRPLSQEDISQLVAIELQSYAAPWSEAAFRSELYFRGYNHARVALSEDTGEIVGYCFFWILEGDEVHINNIAVHPNYRRRGIAQQLMEECIKLGRKYNTHSLTLEVRKSNRPARAFYKKMGFVEKGCRLRFYTEPVEDAMILRYWLTD